MNGELEMAPVEGADMSPVEDADDNDFDPSTNAKLKRFAELEVERQSAAIDRLLNQHVADFKWLTASLLLLNSGSSVAILNTDAVSLVGKQMAGVAFVSGISLALLIGVASQALAMRSIPSLVAYRAFWIAVSQGEPFDAETEREAMDTIQTSGRFSWSTKILGWFSAIAFVTGATIAGVNLREHDEKANASVTAGTVKQPR